MEIPKKQEQYIDINDRMCSVCSIVYHGESNQIFVLFQFEEDEKEYILELEKFQNRFSLIKHNESINQEMIGEFLEIEYMKDKIIFLQKHRSDLSKDFLELVSQCMDFANEADTEEELYANLVQFLNMRAKYELRR